MTQPHFTKLVLVSSIAFALAACGSSSDDHAKPPITTPPPPAATVGDVVALTASNRLVSFDRATPGTIRSNVLVTGLQSGENLVGIDVRPADGLLYGVGSTGRLYTLDAATGAATSKSRLAADAADTSAPFTALAGASFGVDFNPMADRLRIVSDSGQSLRINVDTGATTTDGSINGGAANTAISASAYTNSFAGTGSTTLYGIDSANATLYVQNPPNDGALAMPVPLGVAIGAANGFDIDARTNMGYMVATVGGARNLYGVNLAATSAPANLIGALGVTEDIRGIALRGAAAPVVLGLADDNRLLGFKVGSPGTIDTSVAISGLAGGETLAGIDVRPKDGMLYGLTSAARLVTIDPATGAATVKATLAADAADTTAPYTAMQGAAFAVDFNPAADRLRVISDSGQSLRINVDTGATTTDGNINRAGVAPRREFGAGAAESAERRHAGRRRPPGRDGGGRWRDGHRRRRERPGAGGAAHHGRWPEHAVPGQSDERRGHPGQWRGDAGDVGDRQRRARRARYRDLAALMEAGWRPHGLVLAATRPSSFIS